MVQIDSKNLVKFAVSGPTLHSGNDEGEIRQIWREGVLLRPCQLSPRRRRCDVLHLRGEKPQNHPSGEKLHHVFLVF